MTIWEHLESVSIDENTNLLSYMILKGTLVITNKLKNNRESEHKYSEKRREVIEDVCNATKKINLKCCMEVLHEIREALRYNGYNVKVCKIKASSRVLIGANEPFGKIPLEVGFFFDPILNLPFIPGSSLKGAFRHALEDLIERDMDKEKAEKIAEIVFGSEKWSGLVGVTDAYPIKSGVNNLLFEPDVVTPHYPGTKTELDVDPNPVTFLTIARDVVFEFYIYFNKNIYSEENKQLEKYRKKLRREYAELGIVKDLASIKSIGDSVKELLDNAIYVGDLEKELKRLKDMGLNPINILPYVDRAVLYAFAKGIGAKTSLGYSRFDVIDYRSV